MWTLRINRSKERLLAVNAQQKKTLNGLIHEILVLRDVCCLRCGATENLQASHIYPKGTYRKLEFDSWNIIFLCFRCHFHWWHKHPIAAAEWIQTAIPKERYDRIKLRSQTSGDGMRDFKTLELILRLELNALKRKNWPTADQFFAFRVVAALAQ